MKRYGLIIDKDKKQAGSVYKDRGLKNVLSVVVLKLLYNILKMSENFQEDEEEVMMTEDKLLVIMAEDQLLDKTYTKFQDKSDEKTSFQDESIDDEGDCSLADEFVQKRSSLGSSIADEFIQEKVLSDIPETDSDEDLLDIDSDSDSDEDEDLKKAVENDDPLYLLRKSEVPVNLLRYTLTLSRRSLCKLNLEERLGELMAMPISSERCLCNGGRPSDGRIYLFRFLRWCKYAHSETVYLTILCALLNMPSVINRYTWPGATKYCCSKCRLYPWWLRAFNEEPTRYLLWLMKEAVAKVKWEDSRYCNNIRDVLLKDKHVSSAFIQMYLERVRPMCANTKAGFVKNVVLLLRERGPQLSALGAFNTILLLCEKYNMQELAKCIQAGVRLADEPDTKYEWWDDSGVRKKLAELSKKK